MAQPCQSAFSNPTPGKFLPFVRFDFLGNVNIKVELFLQIRHKSTSISSDSAELLNRRVSFACWSGSRDVRLCIMDIGGMNDNRQ